MRRHGRSRARFQQRTQAPHAGRGQEHALAQRRRPRSHARRAQRDRTGRAVGQADQQAALATDRPIPVNDKRAPRKRMRRRDHHHLGRQRSAQLTQSVRCFVKLRSWRIGLGGTNDA